MTRYIVGLDLGQAQDPTAVCVVEVLIGDGKNGLPPGPSYHVRHLQRFRLGTPYPEIVTQVTTLMGNLKDPEALLAVDATGVGRPVVDLLRQAGLAPLAITITAGDKVTHEGKEYRVPKRDLVAALQVALQSQKLKIAASLPDAKTLIAELLSFKVRIDPKTAHDSYDTWREGAHDDLVLATGIAVWAARKMVPTENRFPLVGIRRRW
jgi:hypothetical protein